MADDADIRWGLAQRFEFIEWRAYWVGRVNRKDLEDEFQISTPQASADFGRYIKSCPDNIKYDATEKCYVAMEGFRPEFLELSPERYLLQLQAITSEAIHKSDTWFDRVPPTDATPTIVRSPEAYVIRSIINAIENNQAININYQSLTSIGLRDICPHALAHDGYRWHVRALPLERAEYRDYVLGRILSVGQVQDCGVDHSDDLEWHTKVALKISAHPNLDPVQKKTIEHDYRLKDGTLLINMRAALVFYFIKRHNLDLRSGQITPERAQLYLQNFDEVTAECERLKKESKKRIASKGPQIVSSLPNSND